MISRKKVIMNGEYSQDDPYQVSTLRSSVSTSYFTNASTTTLSSSLWQGIGVPISNLIQTIENKLSQWFWENISNLPKHYFSNEISDINYLDKSLWEGIFNDQVAQLQQHLIFELAENQRYQQSIPLQNSTNIGLVKIDKLKEQMAAGLPKPTLEEQLIQLQGLVGQYTLSPQCYEQSLNNLKEIVADDLQYTTLIDKIKASFRIELKNQEKFLIECFHGEVLFLFKESAEKLTLEPLKLKPFKNILNYYEPLMKPKTYTQQQHWLRQCYETQSFLPSFEIKQEKTDSPSVITSLATENKQDGSIWQVSIGRWGKLIWKNAGKLIGLGLAAQVAVSQAAGTTNKRFTSANNLPNTLPFLLALRLNRTLPMVNKAMPALKVTATLTRSSTVQNDTVQTESNALDLKHYANSTSLTTKNLHQHYYVDISEVLRQFDKVDAALQEAISMFSTNNISLKQKTGRSRKARSADILGRRPRCIVSKDKLDELETLINATLSNKDQNKGDINCNSDLGQSNNRHCENILNIIQCGVANLRGGYSTAMQNNISQADYNALINKCDELAEKLRRVTDGLTLESDQKLYSLTNKYNTEIANIKSESTRLLESMKGFTIKLCVSEIHGGRITEAFNYFTELKDDSKLSIIITDSYNLLSNMEKNNSNNKLNNVENIMQFRQKLPYIHQAIIVFQSLYDAMERNNHLDSPKVLILDYAVKEFMRYPDHVSADRENKLTHLRDKLAPSITKIITAWATRRDYAQIKSYAGQSDIAGNNINDCLPNIIQIAYAGNLGNFNPTLNFINELPSHLHLATGYTALFSEMYRNSQLDNSEIIKLAYKVKEAAGMVQLKYSFPVWIRKLIWNGSRCRIKNIEKQEYLYAANWELAYDRNRRMVFTWRPGNQVRQGEWELKPINEATAFTVKNIENQEYLYAANSELAYDGYRRRVFTWRPGNQVSQGDWKFEPINGATAFRIKNIEKQEYLYAADSEHAYDRNRRMVFTWRSGNQVRQGDWQLYCP